MIERYFNLDGTSLNVIRPVAASQFRIEDQTILAFLQVRVAHRAMAEKGTALLIFKKTIVNAGYGTFWQRLRSGHMV